MIRVEGGGHGLLSCSSFICCASAMAAGAAGVLRLYFWYLPALIYVGSSRLRCRPDEETCPNLLQRRSPACNHGCYSEDETFPFVGAILLTIATSVGWDGSDLGAGHRYQ